MTAMTHPILSPGDFGAVAGAGAAVGAASDRTIGALQEESRAAILALRKDIMRLRNAERGEMLKKLGLEDQIHFHQLDPTGFDRILAPGVDYTIGNGFDLERVQPAIVGDLVERQGCVVDQPDSSRLRHQGCRCHVKFSCSLPRPFGGWRLESHQE